MYLARVPAGLQTTLLLDSWGGHCPATLQTSVPVDKPTILLTIPKKTTGLAQPLDVYGFRVWKGFVKRFSDLVLLHNIDINLHHRNMIIKLQSLVHNQLSSARYRNLFLYSWYKSGYIESRPGEFVHPVTYAFSFHDERMLPTCSICGKPAFIRCARCSQYFCFQHFFQDYHYHDEQ